MVRQVRDKIEFDALIKRPTLVVVDYYAVWCGPCKKISPFIEELEKENPNVLFLKVDVDQSQDISHDRCISSMPTFHFFRDGNLLEELKGADPQGLKRLIELHNTPLKDPSEMTIKELKSAIVHAGLAQRTLGFSEKHEYVELVKEYYSSFN